MERTADSTDKAATSVVNYDVMERIRIETGGGDPKTTAPRGR